MLKFKGLKHNSTKKFVFLLGLFSAMQASAASVDQLNSLTQEQFQGCAAAYPKLINNYASDSIDAGTIDIQSNGDNSLDNNVLLSLIHI